MRGWWMKGMFTLLARAGTSRGPYAGWEVFMVGPMVGLDRKVPSPKFRVLSASAGFPRPPDARRGSRTEGRGKRKRRRFARAKVQGVGQSPPAPTSSLLRNRQGTRDFDAACRMISNRTF